MRVDCEVLRLLRVIVENEGLYFDKRERLTSEGMKALSLVAKLSGRRGYFELKSRIDRVRKRREAGFLRELLAEAESWGVYCD